MGKIQVAAFVEPDVAERIDGIARDLTVSRSDAIRGLLLRGIKDFDREQRILSEHEPVIRRAS